MTKPAAAKAPAYFYTSTVQLSMLAVLGVAFRAAEIAIPTPVPWLRLGLANVAVLVSLSLFGARAAILVNLTRIVLASVLLGTFLTPGFWLSFVAGMSACASMIFIWYCLKRWITLVGVSIVGAYFHTMSQFIFAYLLFVKHSSILKLMPYFLLVSLATGSLTGLAATVMVSWARRHGLRPIGERGRDLEASSIS